MNNFALFMCGTIVALISGLGILVYMVSVGYEKEKKPEKKPVEVDIDPGAINKSMESFAGIPSVS